MKKAILISTVVLLMAALTACGGNKATNNAADGADNGANPPATTETSAGTYVDGTYKGIYDRKDVRNWIAYVEITVKDGKVEKAYYDYTNENGDLRTNDENYSKAFENVNKMTPREAFDKLGENLVSVQSADKVDVVSGATHSSRNFNELAAAALEKAKTGDTSDAVVNLYEDGTYKVEADAFDAHGWKPFIELVIKDHKIDSVNFDYVNEEGAMKTENAEYKAAMEPQSGTYPEKYTAELEQQLIDKQLIGDVDVITGATTSSNNFHALVEAALDDMAEIGDTSTKAITIAE
ncbi:FMN-binding protein [Paenibacillus antibioticophila]|uniref:FMN-binding protein n=1 Tax=Paenibacillus antibioticophila TaxID=1274374 RepID=UPI0005C916E4|nr:FMN-binding protein [Paenibacillus antibioticophila]